MHSQIFGGEHYAFTAMRHIWKFSQLCRWNKVCSFHTYELEINLVASIFFYKNKQDTWFQLIWAGDIFGVLDFLSQIYTFSHIFAVDIFLADYYRLWPRVSNCIISGHLEIIFFKVCRASSKRALHYLFANLGLSKANFKLFYANQMVRILLINDIILWCGSSTRGFYLTIQTGIFMWEVLHKFSNLMSWILKLASLLSNSRSLIGRYLSRIQKDISRIGMIVSKPYLFSKIIF